MPVEVLAGTVVAHGGAWVGAGRRHTDRLWAVEGCNGIGRHVAPRLLADGETVVDVPAKLSARARVFATGQGRKTDPVDARSVAVVALRTPGMRQVVVDDTTVALRLLVDRRDQLRRTRTEIVSRLHHLLLELMPGAAKKDLSAQQARALLNTVRPRDVVGKTRRWLASELIHELPVIDKKIKIANAELTDLVASTGSRQRDLHGIGPSGAAKLLGDIGDIRRFASRAHFASCNGTAPLDASSGDQNRHRLSRAGNRRINRAPHITAVAQPRPDTEGRRHFRRKLAAGKTPMEAMRAWKRRLSDVVYRQMMTDANRLQTGPGGHAGATLTSSAADLNPMIDTSDKPLPGLTREPTPPAAQVDAEPELTAPTSASSQPRTRTAKSRRRTTTSTSASAAAPAKPKKRSSPKR